MGDNKVDFYAIAMRNARRGHRVFPIDPETKTPAILDWPNQATVNEAQIAIWAVQFPHHNVGIAGGHGGEGAVDLAMLDSDRLPRLKELCGSNWENWSRTFTVGRGNPDRLHLYYRATDEILAFGNKRFSEVGIKGNVFEIKVQGGQCVGEGSVHPDGGIYAPTQDLPLIEFPHGLYELISGLYLKENPTGKREWAGPIHDGEGREDFLVREAGRLRHVGASEAIILAHLEELNSDPAVMADPKPHEDLIRIAHSIGNKPLPPPEPKVKIGTAVAVTSPVQPDFDVAERTTRPEYPDTVWEGTIFGAFADTVCRGNFIRKKLASESFRNITGAIAGDKVTCGIAGVRLREYHVFIAEPQSGKNVVLDDSTDFYVLQSSRCVFEPLLIEGSGRNKYRPAGIGVQKFLPGSSNSFVDEQERKPKHKKGESVDVDLQHPWRPTPRYITIQGEGLALIARLANPDWQGRTMSALITDLYDSTDVEVPITEKRGAPKHAVKAQYSLLLYTQPRSWRKHMAGHTVDSGLFGRFYIVGSEYQPQKMDLPDYRDPNSGAELFQDHFGALRRDVFARLEFLKEQPLVMTVAPEAKRRMLEWENSLSDDEEMEIDLTSRMGLHIKRAAMARAWGAIPQRTEITIEDADAAILLGQYQLKMRERYAPIPGDSPRWQHLNAVRMACKQVGQIGLRELRRDVRGDRWPDDFEWAIGWLIQRNLIAIRDLAHKRKLVCWVAGNGEE